MGKQIVAIGSLFAILVVTLISVLTILDVITVQELRTTLGKSLSALIVLIAGALAFALIVKLVNRTDQRPH